MELFTLSDFGRSLCISSQYICDDDKRWFTTIYNFTDLKKYPVWFLNNDHVWCYAEMINLLIHDKSIDMKLATVESFGWRTDFHVVRTWPHGSSAPSGLDAHCTKDMPNRTWDIGRIFPFDWPPRSKTESTTLYLSVCVTPHVCSSSTVTICLPLHPSVFPSVYSFSCHHRLQYFTFFFLHNFCT